MNITKLDVYLAAGILVGIAAGKKFVDPILVSVLGA